MSQLPELVIRGVAGWASGLPSWHQMVAFARGESLQDESAPKRPAPTLLPANERRRAPDSVLLALEVAQAACADSGLDPAVLPSIFTSTHGDLAITDYMGSTLARAAHEISPTKFHNSVHNAAAGYWTIGIGCHAPATAISAYDYSFGQGMLEAALQIAAGESAVLLVAYDSSSTGPLASVSRSTGLVALALVLSAAEPDSTSGRRMASRLTLQLENAPADSMLPGPLQSLYAGNAMAPAMVFADALALGQPRSQLACGPNLRLNLVTAT